MNKLRLPILFLVMILLISACNLPSSTAQPKNKPNIIFTAAAQTVEAQLTQNTTIASETPAAASATAPSQENTATPQPAAPTPGPAPTFASTPTSVCDAAQFMADVSIPDGTQISPNGSFTKTWRLKNIGSCTWDAAYALVFDSGDAMSGPGSIALGQSVAPGQQIELSVDLKAPSQNGTYRGYWKLRNQSGTFLPISNGYQGKSFYVEIQVKDGATGASGGKFAVTSVAFNVSRSGTCASGKYIVTASITTNNKGPVTYTWIRSDGATGSALNGSVTFDDAGTKTISFEWSANVSGLWVDLYVDNPNHQQFGRATLNCP